MGQAAPAADLALTLRWSERCRASRCPQCQPRTGLLIQLVDSFSHNLVGQAEAWPLPGWSRETVPQLIDLLRSLPQSSPTSSWQQLSGCSQLPPSLAWAISAALEIPAARVGTTRSSAWLLHGTAQQVRRAAQRHHTSWQAKSPSLTPILKLKIGAWAPSELLDFGRWLSLNWPQCRLRLDANQRWSLDAIRQCTDELSSCVDYWEDPCAAEQLQALIEEEVPIALDESLRENAPVDSLLAQAAALICKPTLLGSVAAFRCLEEKARALNKPLILSSCFEGGLTQRQLMSLSDPRWTHGLDPYWHHEPDGALLQRGCQLIVGKKNGWPAPQR
jgi:O-succinylbenzoate synthase